MTDYNSATYGDNIASIYDEWIRVLGFDTETTVDLLASLAGRGPVLELGIGTGRVALPLAAKGISVEGIDVSAKMVDELRKKPGGMEIPVTIADFSKIERGERFSLIYVVFNTFFALLTQEAQVRCFQKVSSALRTGGLFLIEAFVPDLARYARNQNISTSSVNPDEVRLDVVQLDSVTQRLNAQQLSITEHSIRMYPVQLRFAWPSELDLMARLAGLQLRDRWGGWNRESFTAASVRHVSVFRK